VADASEAAEFEFEFEVEFVDAVAFVLPTGGAVFELGVVGVQPVRPIARTNNKKPIAVNGALLSPVRV